MSVWTTTVDASKCVSTPWGATSVSAQRVSSSVTTSIPASIALMVRLEQRECLFLPSCSWKWIPWVKQWEHAEHCLNYSVLGFVVKWSFDIDMRLWHYRWSRFMASDYKKYGQMGAALLLLVQNKMKWYNFPFVNDMLMQRSCLIVL